MLEVGAGWSAVGRGYCCTFNPPSYAHTHTHTHTHTRTRIHPPCYPYATPWLLGKDPTPANVRQPGYRPVHGESLISPPLHVHSYKTPSPIPHQGITRLGAITARGSVPGTTPNLAGSCTGNGTNGGRDGASAVKLPNAQVQPRLRTRPSSRSAPRRSRQHAGCWARPSRDGTHTHLDLLST